MSTSRYKRIISEDRDGTTTVTPVEVLPENPRREVFLIQNRSAAGELLYRWGSSEAGADAWLALNPGAGGMMTAGTDALYIRSNTGSVSYVIQTFRGA